MWKWINKTMDRRFMLDDDGASGGSGGGRTGDGSGGDGTSSSGSDVGSGGAGIDGTGTVKTPEERAAEEKAVEDKAKADKSAADSAELERLRSENAEHKKFIDSVNSNYEYDDNGLLILKGSKKKAEEESLLTDEEKEAIRRTEEAAGRAAEGKIKAAEAAKEAKNKVSIAHADDPFFKENMVATEEFMAKTPIEKRSENYYEHAYAMAAGKKLKDYQKHYFDAGKAEGIKETTTQQGAGEPGGKGSAGEHKEEDLSKVILTPEELRVATKFVEDGVIASIDVYKKSKLQLAKQDNSEE